jgi:hypothetical protein
MIMKDAKKEKDGMLDASTKGLKTLRILLSVLSLPAAIVCIVFGALEGIKEVLLLGILLAVLFVAMLWAVSLAIRSPYRQKNEFLKAEGDLLTVSFSGNSMPGSVRQMTLPKSDVLFLEYHKPFFKSVLEMIHSFLLPGCLFITFRYEGKDYTALVGYPDYKELVAFCKQEHLKLLIK